MSEAQALTPRCPQCGSTPVMQLGTQAFCGDDECAVVTWNTARDAVEQLADANVIDVTGLDHTHHWAPKREGTTATGEPNYVLRCEACHHYYRHGEVTDQ